MKIILISPYPDIHSFGLRTISACLKEAGHQVQLLFLVQPFTKRYKPETLEELVEFAKGADLIGISLMTNFFDNAVQLTQTLKKNTNLPIIWGGIHPTIRPEECLNYADLVALGEAEQTIQDLACQMEKKEDFFHLKGIGFKRQGRTIINQPNLPIQDLDQIPFQDHNYQDHFILDQDKIRKMDIIHLKLHLGVTYATIPTRGCPFRCAYCCNNTLNRMYASQKLPRKRSIGNIIRELIEMKQKLPFVRVVKFDDDSFLYYPREAIQEFSREYKKKIGLSFVVTGACPSTLTREKLSFLVEAGLYSIRMGIQTASQATKQIYQRYHTNQDVLKAARIINQFKDKISMPQYDIILDNPWESQESLVETLLFLSQIPVPYALSLFSLNFYPGTELYDKAKAQGLIKDDLKDVYQKHYHACQDTYLNRLFFLIGHCARIRIRIPSPVISFLTQSRIRKSKNIQRFFKALVGFLILFSKLGLKIQRLAFLVKRSFQLALKGDYARINDYAKRRLAYLTKREV